MMCCMSGVNRLKRFCIHAAESGMGIERFVKIKKPFDTLPQRLDLSPIRDIVRRRESWRRSNSDR